MCIRDSAGTDRRSDFETRTLPRCAGRLARVLRGYRPVSYTHLDVYKRQLSAASQAGVDSVFLALKGNTARAIAPQLALAGLGGKSRVATSQLVSGTGKPEQDSALDGSIYPTEVCTARGVPGPVSYTHLDVYKRQR